METLFEKSRVRKKLEPKKEFYFVKTEKQSYSLIKYSKPQHMPINFTIIFKNNVKFFHVCLRDPTNKFLSSEAEIN